RAAGAPAPDRGASQPAVAMQRTGCARSLVLRGQQVPDLVEVLADAVDAFPGMRLPAPDPARRAVDVEGVAALDPAQLFPAQRHGDRGAVARAQRERGDAGRAAPVAQVVDEDAA